MAEIGLNTILGAQHRTHTESDETFFIPFRPHHTRGGGRRGASEQNEHRLRERERV